MRLLPTAATALARPRRECTNGFAVGRGVDPAGGGAQKAAFHGLPPFAPLQAVDFGRVKK